MIKEIEFTLPKLTLRGYESGTHGPTILCLHGWQDNSGSFIPLMQNMENYRLLCPDLAGHGLSDWRSPDSQYLLIDYVEDIFLLIKQLNAPCFIVGHSMGGIIATLLSASFPELVKAVVLIDSVGIITSPPAHNVELIRTSITNRELTREKTKKRFGNEESIIAARQHVSELTKEQTQILMQRNICIHESGEASLTTDPRIKTPSAFRYSDQQAQAICEAVQCPVKLIQAEQGYELFQSQKQRFYSYYQQISATQCPGGHHCHIENPEIVAKLIINFLTTLD